MNEILQIIARMIRTLSAVAFLVLVGWLIYGNPRAAGGLSVLVAVGWAWMRLPRKDARTVHHYHHDDIARAHERRES